LLIHTSSWSGSSERADTALAVMPMGVLPERVVITLTPVASRLIVARKSTGV
jgi:hypothetical protein